MKSIFNKLLLRFIIVSLIIIIFMGFSLLYFFEDFYFSTKKQEILQNSNYIVNYLSKSLENENDYDTEEWLKVLSEINSGQVWLINKSNILKRSYPSSVSEGKKINLDVFNKIFEGSIVSQKVDLNYFERPMLLVGFPIKINNDVEYSLVLFTPVAGINSTINQVKEIMFYSSLIAILITLIISYTLSKRLTKPLKEMNNTALQLSKGNFGKKINVNSNDELGTLADSMNYMSKTLKTTINNLYEEKNKLKKILTGMKEGVLAINSKGKIILFNESGKNILEVSENLSNKNLFSNDSIKKEKVIKTYQKSFENKEFVSNEINLYNKEGKITKKILLNCSPIYINDDYFWGIVGLFENITKRWEYEKLQKDFVANVSHELKTPLSSIKGSAEILVDGILNNEKKEKDYLKTIVQETERLEKLVYKILDLSKLESNEFLKESINLNEFLKNEIKFLKRRSDNKRKINIVLPKENLFIKFNRDRLRQVLLNLFDNADKFSHKSENIEIGVKKINNEVKVWVKDYGIGIPKNEIDNIWDRFYKIDKSRNTAKKGSGLGLAIVKKIIEENNGRVFVDSKYGKGSVFGFYLNLN